MARGLWRIVRGSWPLWVGALVLAGLNALTLVTRGGPWGVTSAFALWGSKLADAAGIDVRSWAYWSGDRAASLDAPVLADATTVMNVGIILGALLAAAAAGTFVLHRRIPVRTAAAAVVGGLLMGYGARLAYGCNIGAYFSGIASFSLHGWAWGALALVGTIGGVRLRPCSASPTPSPATASAEPRSTDEVQGSIWVATHQRPPSWRPLQRADLEFLVARAGFEPTTSGL